MKLTRFEDVPLTPEQMRDCTKLATSEFKKMPYKKVTKGHYELYCPYCQNYHRISSSELKTIQQNKKCPTCNSRFLGTTREDHYRGRVYVQIGTYGYMFFSEWKFGEPIQLLDFEQVACFLDEDKTWIKCGYYLGNFGRGIYYDEDQASSYYRYSRSPNYERNCYHYSNCPWVYRNGAKTVKKKMLEKYCSYIKKSNQRKILQDYTIPIDYVYFFKLFDINSYEDFAKYRTYYEDNWLEARELVEDNEYHFNVFYLDYLYRHEIRLSRYISYANKMQSLEIKLDKPSNFEVREKIINDMYELHKDELLNKKIAKRYNSLPKYETGDIAILPFKDKAEMVECGKQLHNCVGRMYVEKYADKKTDVYHLDVKGKMTITIEILNKALNQARSDENKDCPKKLLDYIKQFCDINGFTYKKFA